MDGTPADRHLGGGRPLSAYHASLRAEDGAIRVGLAFGRRRGSRAAGSSVASAAVVRADRHDGVGVRLGAWRAGGVAGFRVWV